MTGAADSTSQKLEDLRWTFDQAFSRSDVRTSAALVEMIAVRAGERRLALRARELRSIVRRPALTSVPSSAPGFAGLAAVRGILTGMYGLAALVGSGSSAAAPEWAALCGDGSVGLVFDDLEGYVLVPPDAMHRAEDPDAHAFSREVVRLVDVTRAVIDVPSLLEFILKRARQSDRDESRRKSSES